MSKNLDLIRINLHALVAKLKPLYFKDFPSSADNIDSDLKIYSGGFFSDSERESIQEFHASIIKDNITLSAQNLSTPRLKEMALKIIARNFPHKLTDEEKIWWFNYSRNRITGKELGAELTIEGFEDEINALLDSNQDLDSINILMELKQYVFSIKNELHV